LQSTVTIEHCDVELGVETCWSITVSDGLLRIWLLADFDGLNDWCAGATTCGVVVVVAYGVVVVAYGVVVVAYGVVVVIAACGVVVVAACRIIVVIVITTTAPFAAAASKGKHHGKAQKRCGDGDLAKHQKKAA
jgi:hypothetical protein